MSRNRLFGALAIGAVVLVCTSWLLGRAALAQSRSVGTGAPFTHMSSALTSLSGHCDTLDGPVVSAARAALSSGDPRRVYVWIQPKDEPEIARAFQEALAVRKLGTQARALADRNFFETVVRVHRAGEGAPYTGLKAAGTPVEPAVAAADKALLAGDADRLVREITHEVEQGIRLHFTEAARARKYDVRDVKAGRKYVAAYVRYVHYVEGIAAAADRDAHGHYPEQGEGH